jgi:predicted nucleotidyltransferase
MKYGFSEKQSKDIIELISKYEEIEEAILFGSRAMGTQKKASDIDITIKGKNADYTISVKLKSDLEDTSLPYFFDIISYNTINSDELKEHIEQYGKIIYQRKEKF